MVFEQIRNIYCVGRNYKAHAEELGNAVPEEPMIFTKPTHALASLNGTPVNLPGTKGEVHYEGELVLHIARSYEPGIPVDELIDSFTLGIDLTLRDVQSTIKAKGQPWLPAKGFRNSAAVGSFIPFPGVEELDKQDFTLSKNGEAVQRGNVSRMIFGIGEIVTFIGDHYGLGQGDLIFTGTPEGVGPVRDGDHFELVWGDKPLGAGILRLTSE